MDACVAFAEENGMMSREEAERARKMGNKTGPGGCRGEACRTYCDDPANQEACMAFAVENGFMTKEEAGRMQEMHEMTGPGGCKGEECRTYCEDPAHMETCRAFAEERGFRGPNGEDQKDKPWPGGCSSPEECKLFCENNPDECRNMGQGPDHPVGQERAMEQRGFEIPPGLMEECRKDPEKCRQQFQQEGNMKGREMPPDGSKPYRPEGLLPMEAFRGDKDHEGMRPEKPGLDASPEQLRVYQMNVKRYEEFQANPDKYNQMPPPGQGGMPLEGQSEQGQYQQQYQQQYNQEYQRQYQEQYQQQYQQQTEQNHQPPQDMTAEQQQMYQQYQSTEQAPPPSSPPPSDSGSYAPPSGSYSPPPESAPPPPPADSQPTAMNFVAAVYSIVVSLFGL